MLLEILLTSSAANVLDVHSLALLSAVEISKKCQISPIQAQSILDSLFLDDLSMIKPLKQVALESERVFTTGDASLDQALGGGLRTGMLWEVAGERFVLVALIRLSECLQVLQVKHSSHCSFP